MRLPGSPKRWREKRDSESDPSGQDRVRPSRARQPAENAHQHERDPDRIQDVHAQQICPRRPGLAQHEFLQAEKKSECEYFGAAPDRRGHDLVCANTLLAHPVRDEREGNAGQEQEDRSR